MADDRLALEETWREVVAELIGASDRPESDIPTLTHKQRAFLALAKPIVLINGYVLLATPHQMAKLVIENELGEYITRVLSERMHRTCSLAVSVDPQASAQATPQAAAPAASQAPDPAPRGAPDAPSEPPAEPAYEGDFGADPNRAFGADPQHHAPAHQPNAQAESQHAYPGVSADAPVSGAARHYAPGDAPRGVDNRRQGPSWEDSFARSPRLPREQPAHDPDRETSLNPRYTFESFVIGSSNRFANGAAVAVAENPARAYNPLFISGGSGLGKTHLLHAAGNYAKVLQPSLRIKYVSSEEFTNDYINSVRDDRQESFKRRYRNLDILMVDDIQFLQGKEGTQEEFFHTFNALHQANKQIILSSDRPPKELTTLEDRLRTRFQAGLIADIQPPDLETRIAILMKKAQADGTRVDREVLELIASRFESSIRELEGALVRVSAYSSLIKQPIDLHNAEVALRDILPDPQDVVITASAIIETTAEHFNLSVATLCGTGKTRAVAHARQLAMYLCRELTDLSLPKIGDQFGGKDHTTVMYADRKIRKEMTEKRDTYDEIQLLTQKIKNAGRGLL